MALCGKSEVLASNDEMLCVQKVTHGVRLQ